MSRILVLGGYGGFGGRISRRLAALGHQVIVAGRSAAKAREFCSTVAGTTSLAVERKNIGAVLAEQRPAIVVDASGPFQAMGYEVPNACIAAGVPYCDIADGRDFVCGIVALDAAARAAGVAVIAGVSSVPTLSGAAVRALAEGMTQVHAVEMAISASNRATAGPAVAAAILGQVGQPLRLFRAGRWVARFGWQEMRRQAFAVAGSVPIGGRLVGLADVPDLALLPGRLPGAPGCSFRAGTELDIQNVALWLGSWAVRWGWISGLGRLSRWPGRLQRVTCRWGSDRSAMIVRVFGIRAGERMARRWTLIAGKGVGPEIPALSVPLLVERILAGKEEAGARDGGLSLDLADYAPAFDGLPITTAIEDLKAPESLYQRVMGSAFLMLPPSLQAIHRPPRDASAEGEAQVIGGRNTMARGIARVMGFPAPGRHALRVVFAERDGKEQWTRCFDDRCFTSGLSVSKNQLVERFGPLRFAFDLAVDQTGLVMRMQRWSAFNVPLPMILAPRAKTREWEADERYHFDVSIALPLIGPVVRYRGWLATA